MNSFIFTIKNKEMTSTVQYNGNLRTTCLHIQSNNEIITDAPTDNNGKGEAFSPTDLVATALASCMLTIMGIKANQLSINLEGTTASIEKIMAANPRRINKIKVVIDFTKNDWPDKTRNLLQKSALTCPVAKSIHPDIEQDVQFNF